MSLLEHGGGLTGPASQSALIARSELLGREALSHYVFSPQARVSVINLSENVTLRIDDPATDERAVMRLHRTGYHSPEQIKSELLWLDALRFSKAVPVPPPISGRHGERVVTIHDDQGEPRYVTVCGWVEGAMPDDGEGLVASFALLGAATARLHEHALRWERPPGFVRRPWGAEQLLGAQPTFGAWRAGIALGREERGQLERAERRIRRELSSFGAGADCYGLVHADLRLANLLVHEGCVNVIDFDDCGPSWLMYDFGSAVSFLEDDPRLGELMASWCAGYRTVRPLPVALEAQLATFVMLRRLVLVGWVARNHATATEAAALGAGYTAGACEVAERYLAGRLS